MCLPNSDKLNVELVWQGKIPTRLFETVWMEVRPALRPLFDGDWSLPSIKLEILSMYLMLLIKGATVHGFDPDGGIIFSNANAQLDKIKRLWRCCSGLQHESLNYNAYIGNLSTRRMVLVIWEFIHHKLRYGIRLKINSFKQVPV